MPWSKNLGWIDWMNSAAREIILEDLLPGSFLFGKDDMAASVAWKYYQTLPEFKGPPVVYDQFEQQLKDNQKQASNHLTASKKKKK
eukprot:7650328-Ditylum_brightwellii.AAC.1